MLKIWDLKKAADEDELTGRKRVSAAQLRVQSDVDALDLPASMTVEFPDSNNLMHFLLHYVPDQGLYQKGHFTFEFKIPQAYPIEPPKVRLAQKIYHPNIDLEGALCLNILREDWKPVLSLNHIMMGIQFLFLEPNPNDPLNRVAAESLRHDPDLFASEVRRAMHGGVVSNETFQLVLP